MARPKEFDRDKALDAAMQVFWTRGYEATSVGDLINATGIGRQSMYDTFGDKHALYLAALDRYVQKYGDQVEKAVLGDQPVRKQLREMLARIIEFTVDDPSRSCMLLSAAAERCPLDRGVQRRFAANTEVMEKALTARFERARREGEIAAHHVPQALAKFFVNAVNGLQISAKSGSDRRTLEQVADLTLSVLG
ncbi:MAG: TetR/AcrR family transcriptional regulator [Deltaproteobacteria bacterium]|nr:TetR/AcrR family transcriptional regulator [Deltaproteobacteria bacterium]